MKTFQSFCAYDTSLHLAVKMMLVDGRQIAQALIWDMKCGKTEIMLALATLLEANHNESGKSLNAVVATANLLVNSKAEYLFSEEGFAHELCNHLSRMQILRLMAYNRRTLSTQEPTQDIKLVRACFGESEVLQFSEYGNCYIANFLLKGLQHASLDALPMPDEEPIFLAVRSTDAQMLMLDLCLKRGYTPMRRHDQSHITSGNFTDVAGEVQNQSHDFAQNALGQYGVVPTLVQQLLNRKLIFSFYGLPEQLPLLRDWRVYVDEALEMQRRFLCEHPEYITRWGLQSLLDDECRMVTPDGSPIISEQTGKQQVPVVDYTDLQVLEMLRSDLGAILSDEEVFRALPYSDLYLDMLRSVDALSLEAIMLDGRPLCKAENGMFDTCTTFRDIEFAQFKGRSSLECMSDTRFLHEQQMERQQHVHTPTLWAGYVVELGQDKTKPIWVSEHPPELAYIRPHALTVNRVHVPHEIIADAPSDCNMFGGCAYTISFEHIAHVSAFHSGSCTIH